MLRHIRLGRDVPYARALALQNTLAARHIDAATTTDSRAAHIHETLTLQHVPTYTNGRRNHNALPVATRSRLLSLAAYVEAPRGGQITFHGPGQLVVYPVLNLRRLGLGVRAYVAALECATVRVLTRLGVAEAVVGGNAEEEGGGAIGVWVGDAKIAAIGIHVRRYVTTHGVALNVTNEPLPYFEHITPCGIVGKGVTSIEKLLCGRGTPTLQVEDVEGVFVEEIARQFGLKMVADNEEVNC